MSEVEQLSYSSTDDADDYFAAKLHSSFWESLTDDQKQQALNQATRTIEQFRFRGTQTDSDQTFQFPRTGLYLDGKVLDDSVVPEQILWAQFEIAFHLAKGVDPEKEMRNLRVTSRGYSSVRITYDPTLVPEYLRYGIPSAVAWNYLLPYLERDSSGTIKLHRVS